MEQKMLVVVSIFSARNFPRRPDCSLLIEAHLNGEVLTSDPVNHSSGVVPINTELAWEMSRKTFQQHKLHRTPIKLMVFALDNCSSVRQKVGYIMLDLRSAHLTSKPDPSWYGVLNSIYSRLKPQLQVGVSLEEETVTPNAEVSGQTEPSLSTVPISLDLDPSGDFYTLGPTSPRHTMHTLSFTLSNAQHLPNPPSNQIYFYYNLLGNDITSELFTPPVFSPECASIRIKSTRDLLSLLFAAQKDVEIHLCSGTDSLCKGTTSLSGLANSDVIGATISLGDGRCTVDIAVKLEQSNLGTLYHCTPTSLTPPSSQAPLSSHPQPPSQAQPGSHSPPKTPTKDLKVPTPKRSAKRNLTQSFEDASLPTPTHSSHSGDHTPLTEGRKSPLHPLSEAPHTSHETRPTQTPVTSTQATGTKTGPVTMATESGGFNKDSAFKTSPLKGTSHNVAVAKRVDVQPQEAQAGVAHKFKFCIDLRSIHNLKLDPESKCHLRYSYPFFGNPYPVLIQPPVMPVIATDQTFSHSFCSFVFATQASKLEEHIAHRPLMVEVWQSCDESHDQAVGIAQIPLATVLSHERSVIDRGATRQVCSLQVPIAPPPTTHPHTLTLGYLNAVLILEDFGPAPQEEKTLASVQEVGVLSGSGGGVSSVPGVPHVGVSSNPQPGLEAASTGEGLVGSLEYNTAVELELWKLSQQEAFETQLKSREAAHMSKLGEELQRRETQRQTLLRQKLDHYSSLERQLQDGLQQLTSQQRVLTEREIKVRQESERLSRERQLLQDEVQRSQMQFQSQYEQQIEIERMKSSELQSQVASLRKQVRELEGKVQSREAEFESYRQQTMSRPESKLHADLSILQLEKAELERKLSVLAKSKAHYKDQWSKALSELAACRQREQTAARERLLTQQRELEAMRMQYMENEHQNSLRQQLNQVKNEVEKLQEQTLSKSQPRSTSPSHTSPPTQSHPHISPPTQSQSLMTPADPNVARWIEERDILLQTGVYSSNDTTIQKLDAKIRQALQRQTAT